MRRGSFPAGFVILIAFATASLSAYPSRAQGRNWAGRTAEIEELLAQGKVTSAKPLGEGRNHPVKLTLEKDGRSIDGLWKPIERGKKEWAWESYQAEVAAYELDKMLGLGMVPPTVVREVEGVQGSLQLWVTGCRLFEDVRGTKPPDPERWGRQISQMKLFDNLISNWDRNARNYMVDSDWNIVLIDHSQAFLSTKQLSAKADEIPDRFDRREVKILRSFEPDYLRYKFGRLLMEPQIDAILARRDALVAHIDELIASRGEDAVLF